MADMLISDKELLLLETDQEFLEDILREIDWFPTGSFIIGGFKKGDSDYDICLDTIAKPTILLRLKERNIMWSDSTYNQGIKIILKCGVINFIFLHPIEYICWGLATNALKTQYDNLRTLPKHLRVMAFGQLVLGFKMIHPN